MWRAIEFCGMMWNCGVQTLCMGCVDLCGLLVNYVVWNGNVKS